MNPDEPLNSRNVVCASMLGMLLCLLFSAIGGCIVDPPVDPSDPVDSTSIVTLMTRAEQAARAKHAAMLDAMADRARAGEFKSMADEKKAFEVAIHEVRRESYEAAEKKHDTEAKPRAKYDGQASADSLVRMADGVRKAGR